jgi:sulfoxide reductase catalytic subunit YedY
MAPLLLLMHIQKKNSWQLPDSEVTPQGQYLKRRQFLQTFGMGLAAGALLPGQSRAATFGFPDSLNPADKLPGVKLTPYDDITSYNNFYEWGLEKGDPKVNANKGWKTEPWTIEIGGLCAKPAKYEVNELIKAVGGIEQRNYRHRCVEAWSMVIPWDGFALAKLAISEPKWGAHPPGGSLEIWFQGSKIASPHRLRDRPAKDPVERGCPERVRLLRQR